MRCKITEVFGILDGNGKKQAPLAQLFFTIVWLR